MASELWGKLIGDRGYLSQPLFEKLYQQGLQLITPIRKNMRNRLNLAQVKLLLHRRTVIETIPQVNTGTGSARRLRRARILLMADEAQAGGGWCDAEIAKALGAHQRTVSTNSRTSPMDSRAFPLSHPV